MCTKKRSENLGTKSELSLNSLTKLTECKEILLYPCTKLLPNIMLCPIKLWQEREAERKTVRTRRLLLLQADWYNLQKHWKHTLYTLTQPETYIMNNTSMAIRGKWPNTSWTLIKTHLSAIHERSRGRYPTCQCQSELVLFLDFVGNETEVLICICARLVWTVCQ